MLHASQPPSSPRHVAVLLGTLQKRSLNERVATVLADLAPPELRLEFVDISRLSVFEQHVNDATPPPEWVLFRQQIRVADGVLFMMPEGRRHVPNVLRNALAIAATPDERNAWVGKPGGVVSVSAKGIARGTADRLLRRTLLSQHVPVMEQPDARVAYGNLLFDSQGRLVNVEVQRFLQWYVDAFNHWVQARHLH